MVELTLIGDNAPVIEGLTLKYDLLKSLITTSDKKEKLISSIAMIAGSNALSKCTTESIIDCTFGIALNELNPNKQLGQIYLIPYRSKEEGVICTLQLGWRGLVTLADRRGIQVKANQVFKCDKFKRSSDGFNELVVFEPNDFQRKLNDDKWIESNFLGIYVVAKRLKDEAKWSEIVTKDEIDKIRNLCAAKNPVWNNYYLEMAKKTAIKRLIKTLPIDDIGENSATLIKADDMAEGGEKLNFERTINTGVIHSEIIDSTATTIQNPTESEELGLELLNDYCKFLDALKTVDDLNDAIKEWVKIKNTHGKCDLTNKAWGALKQRGVALKIEYSADQKRFIEPLKDDAIDAAPATEKSVSEKSVSDSENGLFYTDGCDVAALIKAAKSNDALIDFMQDIPPKLAEEFNELFQERQDFLRYGSNE